MQIALVKLLNPLEISCVWSGLGLQAVTTVPPQCRCCKWLWPSSASKPALSQAVHLPGNLQQF